MPNRRGMSGGTKQRVLIIANRLPLNVKILGDGQYEYSQASGGLVTGLSGLPESYNKIWYGWADAPVPEKDRGMVQEELRKKHGVPLWMDKALMGLHYDGFSNRILWPLFHYQANDMTFDEDAWDAYVEVNRQFAVKIAPDVQARDIVWAQDYHLMLFPQMLREELQRLGKIKPDSIKVGFFLHIPFPSSVEFRKLPYRNMVLRGLLHSDLIGFHTYDYARHFLSACTKTMYLITTPNGVQFEKRTVHVGAFPIGIKPSIWTDRLKEDTVKARINRLKEKEFDDRTVIIRVDRADYIKGLPHKFHAFEQFLQQGGDKLEKKVVLVQVAVPTRENVKEYQQLRSHINELAGRINAKYGNIDYQPVVYRFSSVPPHELTALYALSDMCLITSTRDGMNLVGLEYIACQAKNHGSLIISEFAGAAQSMKGCIVINPWDTGEVVEALMQAMNLTTEQKAQNWKTMNQYVQKFTSENWGKSFIEDLQRVGESEMQEVRMRRPSDELSNGVSSGLTSPDVSNGSFFSDEDEGPPTPPNDRI